MMPTQESDTSQIRKDDGIYHDSFKDMDKALTKWLLEHDMQYRKTYEKYAPNRARTNAKAKIKRDADKRFREDG
jgi:hypothetical protein